MILFNNFNKHFWNINKYENGIYTYHSNNTFIGMVTYQVSLEVDEDSSRHLGNEDEEEAGEVLQTEDRRVSSLIIIGHSNKSENLKAYYVMVWFKYNLINIL